MLQPNLVNTIGQLRYQELLQEAEVERKARRLRRTDWKLRQATGELLIVVGLRLRGPLPSSTMKPALQTE